MKHALLVAGAILILAGPALADEVTIEKDTTTTTTTEPAVPSVGSTEPTVIVAPSPPPAPRVEVPPPVPGPGLAWIPGHWTWNPGAMAFGWIAGRYAEAPRAHAAWDTGHWVHHGDGWVWEEGHWD